MTDLDKRPVMRDPTPRRAMTWARFGGTPALVEVEVCRWEDRACGIRFLAGERAPAVGMGRGGHPSCLGPDGERATRR